MGQQASSDDKEPFIPKDEPQPTWKSRCCGSDSAAAAAAATPNRDQDSVVIAGAASPAPILAPGRHAQRARQPGNVFGCGFGLARGPAVEVAAVEPRKATVTWSCPQAKPARMYHISVLRLPPGATTVEKGQASEIGFFEADGHLSTFELPAGTLERASGPYSIQVTTEAGTREKPRLSHPGSSPLFHTPPEPPGAVVGPVLAGEPAERGIGIQWGAPADNGGAAIECYEVTLWSPPSASPAPDGPGEAASEALPGEEDAATRPEEAPPLVVHSTCSTQACSYDFCGLPPGAGPYRAEVRAKSAAGLLGPAAWAEASTAVAAPTAPSALHARLLPAWPCGGSERCGSASIPRGSSCGVDAAGGDTDLVRLDFRAPAVSGGRPLLTFLVYAESDNAVDDAGGERPSMEMFGSNCKLLCTVPASSTATSGKLAPGSYCACDVAVEPNRSYAFTVEACNGSRQSGPGEPTPPLFVPARVPMPPREPPEVFRVQGGFAAELRWVGPLHGGGLPLLSFKIGIISPSSLGADGTFELEGAADVQREVSVSQGAAIAGATASHGDIAWQPAVQADLQEALYGARVEGLQADARYCFVLAASNAVGTGLWSKPSSLVCTPVAAPAMPVNAVATVILDAEANVMVTCTWECGRGCAGSGTIAAFHVMLVPMKFVGSGTSGGSSDTVLRERVHAPGTPAGRRMSWATKLKSPGHYRVEITAENTAGQRSPPAALALDVRPEAFPPPEPEHSEAPHWAEEPVLVLGPAGTNEASCFTAVDPANTMLQSLLLWNDAGPGPDATPRQPAAKRMQSGPAASPYDVVCSYRCPGSNQAHVAVLAPAVTASRLQIALPSHVPMSLRLVVSAEGKGAPGAKASASSRSSAAAKRAKVQSEPLCLLMSDGSEHLKPTWDVWSRQSPDGQPPRWAELPEPLQISLEAAWLEGQPKTTFELPNPMVGAEYENCPLAPGFYELTFGDDRLIQHSVRRAGAGGWNAKARRMVRDSEGEDAAAPGIAAEEQCVVCMERRRTHAFMHAETGDSTGGGHLAVCGACAESFRAESAAGGGPRAVRTCPMCRRPFTSIQRIYQ